MRAQPPLKPRKSVNNTLNPHLRALEKMVLWKAYEEGGVTCVCMRASVCEGKCVSMCECVCVREREREREGIGDGHW